MSKKSAHNYISVFAFLVLIGGIGLIAYSFFPQLSLTGFAIYDPSITLTFVDPTPSSGSSQGSSITLNVTSSVDLDTAWLEWNGQNESLTGFGQTWSIDKSGSGSYTYKVYGNTSNDTYSSTEERTVTLSTNFSLAFNVTDQYFNEDANVSLDLGTYTNTSQQLSDISYSVINQGNTSLINCNVNGRYLNCTLGTDISGNATTVLRATYQANTSTSNFSFNIAAVNDAPRLKKIIPNQTLDAYENKTLDLSEYFTDVENQTLNYSTSGDSHLTISFNKSVVTLSADNSDSYFNISFIAQETLKGYSNQVYFNLSSEETSSESVIPEVTQGSFTVPDQTWLKNTPLELDLGLYLTSPPANPVYTVQGLSTIAATFTGAVVTLTPTPNWYGVETATFVVDGDNTHYTSNAVTLTVTNQNSAPTVQTQLPDIFFDENQTSLTLDLNTYFTDPDGDTLTYEIGDTEAVNTSMQSTTVVIFSLASIPTEIENETIVISATDPSGEKISDEILITVADSLQDELPLSLIFSLFLGALLVSGVYVSYRKRETLFPKGANPFKASWISNLFTNKEIGSYREERYYLKQGLGIIDALIVSTDDKAAKTALVKERERIAKADRALAKNLGEKVQDDILTLREVKTSLLEIKAASSDKLIREELTKEIGLLNKVLKSFYGEDSPVMHKQH